jgi:hypothetical protein
MLSAQTLSDLLYTLYNAPAHPEGLWPKFLEDFINTLGVSAAGIVYQDAKRVSYGFNTNARIARMDPLLKKCETLLYYVRCCPTIIASGGPPWTSIPSVQKLPC